MLTDIFAYRYAAKPIWTTFTLAEKRMLVQTFRILEEDIRPYYDSDGSESAVGKAFWKDIQRRISTELGLQSLSALGYSYQSTFNGKPITQSGMWTLIKVCETWMFMEPTEKTDIDRFIKERLSLIEFGFRKRWEEIEKANEELPQKIEEAKRPPKNPSAFRLPGNPVDGIIAWNKTQNESFNSSANELNERLNQAGCNLHYHNGFVQLSTDSFTTDVIETPFWSLLSDSEWKNVDLDMKEAFDQRDNGGRDPAFYAARSLESTIKIISNKLGCTHGNERGAQNYIDNISSKKVNFIERWEADFLKLFFKEIRNPLGHGAGSAEMPKLASHQTNWAIEQSISWIKALIERLSLGATSNVGGTNP